MQGSRTNSKPTHHAHGRLFMPCTPSVAMGSLSSTVEKKQTVMSDFCQESEPGVGYNKFPSTHYSAPALEL
jgi:hypothetical protein